MKCKPSILCILICSTFCVLLHPVCASDSGFQTFQDRIITLRKGIAEFDGESWLSFYGVINTKCYSGGSLLIAANSLPPEALLTPEAIKDGHKDPWRIYYISLSNLTKWVNGTIDSHEALNMSLRTRVFYNLWQGVEGNICLARIPEMADGKYYVLIAGQMGPSFDLTLFNDPNGNEFKDDPLQREVKWTISVSAPPVAISNEQSTMQYGAVRVNNTISADCKVLGGTVFLTALLVIALTIMRRNNLRIY